MLGKNFLFAFFFVASDVMCFSKKQIGISLLVSKLVIGNMSDKSCYPLIFSNYLLFNLANNPEHVQTNQ